LNVLKKATNAIQFISHDALRPRRY